jgi:parallel beta-helix repeat protein
MKTKTLFSATLFMLFVSFGYADSSVFHSGPQMSDTLASAGTINVLQPPFSAYNDASHPIETAARINAAIDSAAVQGKKVYLPGGIYLLSYRGDQVSFGGIRLRPGSYIFGDSGKTIIRRIVTEGKKDGVAISTNGAGLSDDTLKNNFTVRDLIVEGATDGRRSGIVPGIGSDGGIILTTGGRKDVMLNRIFIDNVVVRNTNKEAIQVWWARDVSITNCSVTNCNFDAYNPAGVQNLVMQNNFADSVEFALEYYGKGTGIAGTGSYAPSTANIADNKFTNVYKAGIRVFGGDDTQIKNNTVIGAKGSASPQGESDGILAHPAHSPMAKLTIVGNTISYSNYFGLDVFSKVTDFAGSAEILVQHNTITNSAMSGIYVAPDNSGRISKLEISQNVVSDWNRLLTGNSVAQCGISVSKVDGAVIAKNKVSNGNSNVVVRNPLFLADTRNALVEDNDFNGTGKLYVVARSTSNVGLKSTGNKGIEGIYDYVTRVVTSDQQ